MALPGVLTGRRGARRGDSGIQVVFGEVARLVVEADRMTGAGLLAGLGCELKAGSAVVDTTGRTSVSAVWAAGNAFDPRAR